MPLSNESYDVLVELIGDALDEMTVRNSRDARQLARLARCRRELLAMRQRTTSAEVVPFPARRRPALKSIA